MQERLSLPQEPVQLKLEMRTLLEQAPEAGMRALECGTWIASPLWDHWLITLEGRCMDWETFRRVVVGYRNELRLWLMGERPWEHCVAGLAGRVERRLPIADPCWSLFGERGESVTDG